MEQYVFYYQINWDRKRPKHLTSLSERPSLEYLPVTQIPLNCIHSSISIPDKVGNYIDSGGKSQNFFLLALSEIYRNQSILGRYKVRIFFIGSNREWPLLWRWARYWPMRGCCQRMWPMRGQHSTDHCPEQWSMECFISHQHWAAFVLSGPKR